MEIKNLKIWSRKKSDRGVYACMPLKRNVPEKKKSCLTRSESWPENSE